MKRIRAAAPAVEEAPTSSAPTTSSTSRIPDFDPAIAQLKSSLEANRVEIENLTNDENRLRASVAQYESRINQTPVPEPQQAGKLLITGAHTVLVVDADLHYASNRRDSPTQALARINRLPGG